MGTLNVNPEGLDVLAARCSAHAGELAAPTAPMFEPPSHAAAMAVQELYGAVGLAGATMAARLQELSDNLIHAGVQFSINEAGLADEFGALLPPGRM